MTDHKMRLLEDLKKALNFLLSQDEYIDFYYQVDWKKLQLYDYPKIIQKPMYLQKIKANLKNYTSFESFLDDVSLIWTNCKLYNQEGSEIVNRAEIMEKKLTEYLHNSFKLPSKRQPDIDPYEISSEGSEFHDEPKKIKKLNDESQKVIEIMADEKNQKIEEVKLDESSEVEYEKLESDSEDIKDTIIPHINNKGDIVLKEVTLEQQVLLKEAIMKLSIDKMTRVLKLVLKLEPDAVIYLGGMLKISVGQMSYNTFFEVWDLAFKDI